MKRPDSFLTNTTAPAGRLLGAAKNNPGDNTGTGADKEIYNDPAYAVLATIESYKEGGNTDTDETTDASDFRDAMEEMVAKAVSGISEWDAGTTYSVPTLVMWKGFQFYAFNTTGNLAKEPLLNPAYWLKSPTPEQLLDMYFSGDVFSGGLSNIANRANASYRQSALIGTYRLGGNGDTFYEFYRVALDGTVVTGDAPLEAIFDVGGGNQYFNLDLIAPDNLGTRTLIDMSSRHIAPQSFGGDNDVLGEVVEDRFQGHFHQNFISGGVGANDVFPKDTLRLRGSTSDTNAQTIITDTVNGNPRTGATTRPKEFTVGSSYIIVMIPI